MADPTERSSSKTLLKILELNLALDCLESIAFCSWSATGTSPAQQLLTIKSERAEKMLEVKMDLGLTHVGSCENSWFRKRTDAVLLQVVQMTNQIT